MAQADEHRILQRLESENERLRKRLAAAEARVRLLEGFAHEDPLCGVLNRRGFERQLKRALGDLRRYGRTSALLYLDLNDFKAVNDTYGHAGGDAALRHVAMLLTESVRASDAVGRLGGDEFVVLLREVAEAQVWAAAHRIVSLIAGTPLHHAGESFTVTVSAGAAMLADGDLATALAAADEDMYARKRDGTHMRPGYATAGLATPA